MTYKKNNSNINIAYWFYNKETSKNKKISEQKIQYLLSIPNFAPQSQGKDAIYSICLQLLG